jgi:hypothetical protein
MAAAWGRCAPATWNRHVAPTRLGTTSPLVGGGVRRAAAWRREAACGGGADNLLTEGCAGGSVPRRVTGLFARAWSLLPLERNPRSLGYDSRLTDESRGDRLRSRDPLAWAAALYCPTSLLERVPAGPLRRSTRSRCEASSQWSSASNRSASAASVVHPHPRNAEASARPSPDPGPQRRQRSRAALARAAL